MSFICRSKTKDNDLIKNTNNDKLRYTKTIDSNKVVSSKNAISVEKTANNKELLRVSNTMKEQSKKFMNKLIEKAKPKVELQNHEKSTFFDGREEIRESDIVFELVPDNKKNKIEEKGYFERSKPIKKWGVLLNVIKALNNMRHISARSVKSLTEIDRTMDGWEKKQKHRGDNELFRVESNFNDEFEEITKQIKLFNYLSSGLDENVEKIAELVRKDPKRNLFDENSKQHYFINQKNYEGVTPLYVACLNGHIKIVEVLMKYNADHLMKCGVI